MLVTKPFATWSVLRSFFFPPKNWEPASCAVIARRQHDEQLSRCYKSASGMTGRTLLNDMLPHQKFCNIQQRISKSIISLLRPTSLTDGACLRFWQFRLLNKLASSFYRKQILIFRVHGIIFRASWMLPSSVSLRQIAEVFSYVDTCFGS